MSAEHEELENSVAAYVLGSAESEDEDRLLAHLEGCVSCRELVARLAPATSSLALEPEPAKPPVRLEARLIAAATAVRAGSVPPQRRPRRFVLSGPSLSRLRLPGVQVGLAAAAVLLFALGGVAGVGLDRLGLVKPAGQPQTQEVHRYQLSGTGPMAGVSATALYLKQDGRTVVDFRHLPGPGQDRVYELWLISDDGRALPAGVFTPGSDGSRVVVVDRSLSGIKAVAVTNEPGPNGSQTPSQDPQLKGSVA